MTAATPAAPVTLAALAEAEAEIATETVTAIVITGIPVLRAADTAIVPLVPVIDELLVSDAVIV